MKKIILVLESWGVGGTETYVAGLARFLISQGFDVSLVLLKNGDEETIDFLPKGRVFVTQLPKLASLLRSTRPDVISVHLYSHLLPVVLLCVRHRFKIITTLHMPLNSWGWRHRLYWRLAIYFSTTVVGVSKSVLEQLNAKNLYADPIPGGVDQRFFACVRKQKLLKSDNYTIVAIGRLSIEKDWSTLIEAVALLPVAVRDAVTIDFYGSGILHADLESMASRRCVRAVFHGYVDKLTLVEALSCADLSVLPSRFEGLGLSALEGMAAGVPTITANFAAANEFIEQGVTGHMFSVGDARYLAHWIEWHIAHPMESAAIGLAGHEFVRQHFSEEVAYLPYIEIFSKVAG